MELVWWSNPVGYLAEDRVVRCEQLVNIDVDIVGWRLRQRRLCHDAVKLSSAHTSPSTHKAFHWRGLMDGNRLTMSAWSEITPGGPTQRLSGLNVRWCYDKLKNVTLAVCWAVDMLFHVEKKGNTRLCQNYEELTCQARSCYVKRIQSANVVV